MKPELRGVLTGARGVVPRRFGAFVPIPEPRLEQFRGVGSKAGHGSPARLRSWPRIGARVAPQESPILRPGQWRLSLRLGSATIAR